jgi:hypothetical protein
VTERAHGTRARYVFGATGQDWHNGCRCFDCSQAAVLYEKRRQRARRRGEVAYVDASEARTHLLWLRSNGIGRRTIEAATGLSNSAIARIANGTVTRIRPATADKILGMHVGRAAPGARIDATSTLAKIDDLVNVVGMTKGAIAAALGAKTRALQVAKKGWVTRANADKVDALWRERMAPIHARRENEAASRAHYRALQQDRTTADR